MWFRKNKIFNHKDDMFIVPYNDRFSQYSPKYIAIPRKSLQYPLITIHKESNHFRPKDKENDPLEFYVQCHWDNTYCCIYCRTIDDAQNIKNNILLAIDDFLNYRGQTIIIPDSFKLKK